MGNKRKRNEESHSEASGGSNGGGDAKEAISDDQFEEKASSGLSNAVVCPFLDTIDRKELDFDMERTCSVSLDDNHVYGCLVCGKFFQGRGVNSPCHTHSVQHGHYVFINLDTHRIYCVPDNYEVKDKSLADIKHYLSPRFSAEDIAGIDTSTRFSTDVHGGTFRPGFVGLNNLGNTDNINAVIQGLAHVPVFRDFCLQFDKERHVGGVPSVQKALIMAVSECVRKIWSPINFKGVISPQVLVKVLGQASNGKFGSGVPQHAASSSSGSTSIDFLRFLLSYMHAAFLNPNLGIGDESSLKSKSTVISECFQGIVEITESTQSRSAGSGGGTSVKKKVPFNYLSLDIPPTPLFRESEGGRVVPNIPIHQLLEKFNGRKQAEQFTPTSRISRSFRLLRLPRYIILNCDRKETQNFSKKGRNCTVITFPVTNLEFCTVCGVHEDHFSCPASMNLASLGDEETRSLAEKYCPLVPASKPLVESHSYAKALQKIAEACAVRKYDLVSNICQSSSAAASADSEVDVASSTVGGAGADRKREGNFTGGSSSAVLNKSKVHVQNLSTSQWYEAEDLEVKEIETRAIGVCEADILIYKCQA